MHPIVGVKIEYIGTVALETHNLVDDIYDPRLPHVLAHIGWTMYPWRCVYTQPSQWWLCSGSCPLTTTTTVFPPYLHLQLHCIYTQPPQYLKSGFVFICRLSHWCNIWSEGKHYCGFLWEDCLRIMTSHTMNVYYCSTNHQPLCRWLCVNAPWS